MPAAPTCLCSPACPSACLTIPIGPHACAGAARDFVQSCLQRDEKQRPSAEALLEHPWLQEALLVSDVPFSDTIVQRLQRFGIYGRWVSLNQWDWLEGHLWGWLLMRLWGEVLLASRGVPTRLPPCCLPLMVLSLPPLLSAGCLQVPPGGADGAGSQHAAGGWRRAAAERPAPRLPGDG